MCEGRPIPDQGKLGYGDVGIGVGKCQGDPCPMIEPASALLYERKPGQVKQVRYPIRNCFLQMIMLLAQPS